MSLRLILTRHAKSSWSETGVPDHERPLNERGHDSAAAIGRWLVECDYIPQIACLSTAQRVVETWADIAPRIGRPVTEVWEPALYHSSPDTMLSILANQAAQTVILIAHNPGMASLAQLLVEDAPQRQEFDYFPTCATLVLEFDVDTWSEIEPMCGRVIDFIVPRDLTD